MSRVPSTFNSSLNSDTFASTDAINDLDLGTFLKLMIVELQNQDPLNPLDNKDMLAQITQIREVGATDQLTKTLESVLLGQNIASATNLIGADIDGLSDDNERVEGRVKQVTIDKGEPKLQVDLDTKATTTSLEGKIEKGTYAYQIVWENAGGKLEGIRLAGDKAVTTTGEEGFDQAISISNLPVTATPKYIYRTDKTGTGNYQLVGVLEDGKQGTFVDRRADFERMDLLTRAVLPATTTARSYQVSLSNVGGIRPPAEPVAPDEEPGRPAYSPTNRPTLEEPNRPGFELPARPSFI